MSPTPKNWTNMMCTVCKHEWASPPGECPECPLEDPDGSWTRISHADLKKLREGIDGRDRIIADRDECIDRLRNRIAEQRRELARLNNYANDMARRRTDEWNALREVARVARLVVDDAEMVGQLCAVEPRYIEKMRDAIDVVDEAFAPAAPYTSTATSEHKPATYGAGPEGRPMKLVITPVFDSDNSAAPEITVQPNPDGGVRLLLSAPSRVLDIGGTDWRAIVAATEQKP